MSEQRTPEKLFHNYACFETSAEVWAVIHARHSKQLKVWSTVTDPSGTAFGGGGTEGRMETTYGFAGADFPLIGARTTWEIKDGSHSRHNQHTDYFIVIPKKECSDD